MILSWGNSATRRLFESGKSRFRGLDVDAALELLAVVHAAERLDHISPLKSVGLHPLKGNRRGQRSPSMDHGGFASGSRTAMRTR